MKPDQTTQGKLIKPLKESLDVNSFLKLGINSGVVKGEIKTPVTETVR